jgi:predicted S18 family serine protease
MKTSGPTTFTILVTPELKKKAVAIAFYKKTSVSAWLIDNFGKDMKERIEATYASIPPALIDGSTRQERVVLGE